MPRRLLCCLLPLLLMGCNLLYRPEMQQGNPVTAEALANLKPGLTKRQVRLVLGSPPVSDPFHPDRWEYVHNVARAGDQPKPPARLTLYFSNDQLVRAEGELAPPTLRPEGNSATPIPDKN